MFITPPSTLSSWSDNVPLANSPAAAPAVPVPAGKSFQPLIREQYVQGLNSGFMADMMKAQMEQTTRSMESSAGQPNAYLGFHSPFHPGEMMQCPKAHASAYPGPPEAVWKTPHYNRPYPCPRPVLPEVENGFPSAVLCLATKK